MTFASRPPSDAWEPGLLPDALGAVIWIWYRPPHTPDGFVLQIPEEARAAGPLTLRRLLDAAGVAPREVAAWSLLGMTFDGQGGMNPLFDQPIPPFPPGDEGVVLVHVRPPLLVAPLAPPVMAPPFVAAAMPGYAPAMMAPAYAAPAMMPPAYVAPVVAPAGPPGAFDELFASMESDWQAILQAETNMSSTRAQLIGMQQRLNSLNRELSPDERLNADSLDKKDWNDARRWLREGATHISRHLRDHDIGVTSGAGARHRFEQIYDEYVLPRRPFDGLAQAQKDFETHRKTAQHLLASMQQTLTAAGRDGEQRAQQILTRIAAKVRGGRKSKRG